MTRNILWDKIARPRFPHRGLFYPLEKCFPAEPLIHRTLRPGKIYSVKKIIKKSLEITEKLHFFYFYFIFMYTMTSFHVIFTRADWPKGETFF